MTDLQILSENLEHLPAGDVSFANSLISQSQTRALSEKQLRWVKILGERAINARDGVAAQPATIANIGGVVKLLETASQHLKHPRLLVAVGSMTLRLSVAGARSKAPGSINVTSVEGDYEGRTWYGRITKDGAFEPSRANTADTSTGILSALTALANDPAKAAAHYGHLTGVCCFCNTYLTDERSTAVGYGPVCAKHYGLPYPKMSDVRKAA